MQASLTESSYSRMELPRQTVTLLKAARQVVETLPADAVLLLVETDLDWDAVQEQLNCCRLFVAPQNPELRAQLARRPGLSIIDIDPGPTPTRDLMSLALLEAVASEQLHTGADVVVLYNGIETEQGQPEHIDSLAVIHLGEHLERLSGQELRKLDTQVPLETLRAVVDVALEIGREGREGKPVGTMFVVGDSRKVMTMARPQNFNPFRGYSPKERDIRDPRIREQIKELALLDGAIVIRRDGVAVAACMYIDALAEGITLSKGLGSRHWAGAAISKQTSAVAVVVSQSSGTVRIFQHGRVVLHIEPMARPLIWRRFELEADDASDITNPAILK